MAQNQSQSRQARLMDSSLFRLRIRDDVARLVPLATATSAAAATRLAPARRRVVDVVEEGGVPHLLLVLVSRLGQLSHLLLALLLQLLLDAKLLLAELLPLLL